MIPQTEVPIEQTQTTMANPAQPTPGYKSSELAVTVASIVPIAMGLIPPAYAPLVAGVAGVYVAARTLLKVVHALGYAKKLPDLPAIPLEK